MKINDSIGENKMKFEEIKINRKLIEKTLEQGFIDLTSIQEKCLPEIIKGKDVIGQAETGSGKTLAFCLPILDKIIRGRGIQTLVITPTRELCMQVSDVFFDYGKSLGVKITSVYGGVSIEPQIKNLRTSEIVVGTPGRILDHLRRKTLDLRNVKFLVIDETDKMFEMGFIDDVEEIIRYVPRKRQTLMFCATISADINRLVNKHLNNPVVVKTQSYVDKSKLKQIYYDINQKNEKFSILVHLLKNHTSGLAIVFCETRRESDEVTRNLRHQGINVSAIHGGMSQNKRSQSIDALKNQRTDVLVATDVAARGLDVKNVTHIYNYDVPKTPTDYIHRIGRTARAGADGAAITLLTERDHNNFRRVQSNDELVIEKVDIPDFKKVAFIRGFEQRRKPFREQQYQQHSQQHQSFNHWVS
jgi:superfamily II DNA/RNA helicase